MNLYVYSYIYIYMYIFVPEMVPVVEHERADARALRGLLRRRRKVVPREHLVQD